jgi:hypothetical protein
VFEQAAGIADNIAKFERDWLKMGLNALAASSLQSVEQLIHMSVSHCSIGSPRTSAQAR